MATTNYGWPQPDKDGIQREEIDRIAAGFEAVDGTLQDVDWRVQWLYTTFGEHTHAFGDITGKPTTVEGYGITDAYTRTQVDDKVALDIDAAINALINGSPGALDTLQELAAALGNDPDFAATVTNQLATKATRSLNLADLPDKAAARANLGLPDEVPFPAGTTMLFRQSAAPTGWTKLTGTAYSDAALRIVTDTVGHGGAQPFSSVFISTRAVGGAVHGHALTVSQIPSHAHSAGSLYAASHAHAAGGLYTGAAGAHTHTVSGRSTFNAGGDVVQTVDGSHEQTIHTQAAGNHTHGIGGNTAASGNLGIGGNTGAAGSGGAHAHGWSGSVDLAVKYIDFIVARKD